MQQVQAFATGHARKDACHSRRAPMASRRRRSDGTPTRSSKGHIWVLAAQDKFTKWTEIRPLRKATAPAVTREIYKDVILRHGAPKMLISDNGRQFTSREFRDMLREAGVQARLTPPYTPQCNPEERQSGIKDHDRPIHRKKSTRMGPIPTGDPVRRKYRHARVHRIHTGLLKPRPRIKDAREFTNQPNEPSALNIKTPGTTPSRPQTSTDKPRMHSNNKPRSTTSGDDIGDRV